MRSSCEIVIDINMTKAMHGPHKIPFWLSANKVVLTAGLEDGSLPTEYFRTVIDWKEKVYLHQAPIDYICMFDLECTCNNDDSYGHHNQEAIELPVVLIDVKTRSVKSVFHTYIKPVIVP